MIKGAGQTADGRPVLLIGLSNENIRRLKADDPIRFEMAPMGLPDCQVVIIYGPTDEQMEARLQSAMTPETVRHGHDTQ